MFVTYSLHPSLGGKEKEKMAWHIVSNLYVWKQKIYIKSCKSICKVNGCK